MPAASDSAMESYACRHLLRLGLTLAALSTSALPVDRSTVEGVPLCSTLHTRLVRRATKVGRESQKQLFSGVSSVVVR